MEKSTKVGQSKGSGIAGNPECDGVGAVVSIILFCSQIVRFHTMESIYLVLKTQEGPSIC